ncbi:YciI family protein [Chelativorans sp.]|uniref:YciI family protein n=1 Tax=Chelativorans sp. TaxID=2203393 RepID=UPI0028114FAE|nr:YciI family protein [Chelativorans sp.]
MLYAILCYHDEDVVMSWSKAEDDAVLAKRKRVQKDFVEHGGKMGPAIRLVPTTGATTIRTAGDEQLVLDGPFAETKEQLLGFYLVDCKDLDEVIDFAKRMKEGESCTFEIRPVQIFEEGTLPEKVKIAS